MKVFVRGKKVTVDHGRNSKNSRRGSLSKGEGGRLSPRLEMKKFFFVFVSFSVAWIWFLLGQFQNDQTLLPLTWEGDGKWIDYTCKKRINKKKNQRGIVMHWNKTAAAAINANKYITTTTANTFLSYSYEDQPQIMTRIDNDGNNDRNTNGNCPFDSFLTKQYCQERPKTTVCVYPDVILKIVHNRMAWLTELYMFSVLNDTKYFPRLIYHTGAAVQRSDILNNYSKTSMGYKEYDYDRTMYDNNDGLIRINKNRNECWTMIIENVRPKGKCHNSFNNTKSSRLYYTKELTSVFEKYFAPNHIWADDLKARNVIIHSDQIHIIDFGLYKIIDDVEKLNKKILSCFHFYPEKIATNTFYGLVTKLFNQVHDSWKHRNEGRGKDVITHAAPNLISI